LLLVLGVGFAKVDCVAFRPTPLNKFIAEMRRFSPTATVLSTLENPAYWDFLNLTLLEQAALAFKALK
jgi:hypothetical protein